MEQCSEYSPVEGSLGGAMKRVWGLVLTLVCLIACAPAAAPTTIPTTPVPPTVTTVPATIEPVFADTALPPAYSKPLELKAVPQAKLIGNCAFKPFSDLAAKGLTRLAQLQYIGCTYGEIGLFEMGERLYAAQSGLGVTTFNLTDVTDPTAPQPIGAWLGSGGGYAADLKPFRQGERHFLAISYDNIEKTPNLCGIAIIEVTDPHTPQVLGRYDGSQVGAETPWCNVHTIEIETDAQGNATYLLASDTDTWSLRVLDIHDLSQIRQINTFHLHAHPHVDPGDPKVAINFVHDSTISADRVYVAYWHAGAVILDKAKLYAGIPQQGEIVQPTERLAPAGFLTHYTFPTADGKFLILEDESNVENGMRLFDIHDPSHPREIATIQLDDPLYTPHNFVIQDNLLYVAWIQDGVRVFHLDMSDAGKPKAEQVASFPVRANKTSGALGPFTGIWGLRVHTCNVKGEARTCIYASDTEGGLLILVLDKGIAPQ